MRKLIFKISKEETHIVPEISTPIRFSEYGVGIFENASTKSALKKAIKKNLITINDQTASTATFIQSGDCIKFSIPEEKKPKKSFVLKLNVLFEDEYLAIIHKPAGILVSGNKFRTVANALVQNLKASNLPDATIPQPIHRLDFETTGILLVGKTSSSIRALSKLFEEKQIDKMYYAIAIGKMENEGIISSTFDGKPAISKYWLEKTLSSERFEKLNLVKLSPLTGRTHQLRKHLLSIGNPILGDKKYFINHLILKGKGLYLHAYSLAFTHPFTQEKMYVKDNFIQRFEKIFIGNFSD